MTFKPVRFVLVVFVSAAFAGCVSEDGKASGGLQGPGSEPVFDDATGAIRGSIVDDEAVPIPGAQAGIIELGITAVADPGGSFALNKVPPGEHVVVVAAIGYNSASKSVAVTAGEATDIVEFVMVPLPRDVPFHKTIQRRVELTGVMWKLTPTCIYEPLTTINPLLKTCGGVRQACPGTPDPCEGHTQLEADFKGFGPEWQSIVSEVRWTAQSGATGKGFHHDLNAPNITRGTSGAINQADKYTFKKASNKSPIMIRVDKDALAARGIPEKDWNNYNGTEARCAGTSTVPPNNNCDWFYRLFPAAYDVGIGEDGFGPDYGVMYQSTVEIYFTYFVKEKAVKDFTAIPV